MIQLLRAEVSGGLSDRALGSAVCAAGRSAASCCWRASFPAKPDIRAGCPARSAAAGSAAYTRRGWPAILPLPPARQRRSQASGRSAPAAETCRAARAENVPAVVVIVHRKLHAGTKAGGAVQRKVGVYVQKQQAVLLQQKAVDRLELMRSSEMARSVMQQANSPGSRRMARASSGRTKVTETSWVSSL